jgi:1,4-alpha-glucan branching enzyme
LAILRSLNDVAFDHGYVVATDSGRLSDGGWHEIFNSDAAVYGGDNVGNGGATLQARWTNQCGPSGAWIRGV